MELYRNINKLKEDKKNYTKSYINKIKKFKDIYLWGISESCDEAINFFNKNKIIINAIIDQNAEKYNYNYKGINVIKDKYENIDKNSAIIITCSYYETIKNKLITKESKIEKRLFIYDGYFLENKNINYYLKNKDTIEKNYKELKDKESKKLYNNLLKYRYIRDPKLISNLYRNREECYLDKIFIDNYKDGLYIDAGSYNADFITTLSNKIPINNSMFYIFEPNKIFYENINRTLDKNINYQTFNIALCDKKSTMEFMQIPSSTSHIIDKKYNAYKNTVAENNISIIETNKLDNIVTDNIVKGIKMDVEGSEYSLIKGATKTIKKDRPIMLIAIYHKWDDLFKIQNYISNLNLDYSFYIRHYSLSVAKTILYCIPNNKKEE